ncbi:MAG: Fic family protein [Actinobacteria bacterium]|nr:MAG: Fic family protein [Actinomycetota bacterium]
MFRPKYSINNNLLKHIKQIASLITELNSQTFSDVILLELEKNAREISSFSSTSIEGNPLPLTAVKKILKSKPSNIRDSEKEVLNYNQALKKLNTGHNRFNLNLILNIQKTITKGLIADYANGKIRKEPVFVNDPRKREPIYLPPDHQDVKPLLNDLIKYVQQNKKKVDPLILAGIFHKQFVIIHPFIDGNGRCARLATKVLLADMGLNTFNLFSFENYYNKNVSRYFQKVGAFGSYYDIEKDIDFTEWLEYFTDGIIDELLRVEKELESFIITPDKTLKPYHQKLLNYIKKNGFITDKDYAKLTERAKATRSLDFRKLIEMGLIERAGKGKSTYYKLKQ